MNITESIEFDKLKEENETLLKELAEKDKEIVKLKQQILFKEDFKKMITTLVIVPKVIQVLKLDN